MIVEPVGVGTADLEPHPERSTLVEQLLDELDRPTQRDKMPAVELLDLQPEPLSGDHPLE
jgi:hypothetical protein